MNISYPIYPIYPMAHLLDQPQTAGILCNVLPSGLPDHGASGALNMCESPDIVFLVRV